MQSSWRAKLTKFRKKHAAKVWVQELGPGPTAGSRKRMLGSAMNGAVRRAKLYYLRSRRGKSARIAEKVDRRFGAAATGGKKTSPATAVEAVEMKDEAMDQANVSAAPKASGDTKES